MRLLIFSIFVLSTFSHNVWAKKTRLAYGGEIFLNTNKWELIDTKSFTPNIPHSFVNKKDSDLKGWLVGGTPDSLAKCNPKEGQKGFEVCHQFETKKSTVYHQIILTRKVDEKAFQNYLISFAYPSEKNKKYSPELSDFVKDLSRKSK